MAGRRAGRRARASRGGAGDFQSLAGEDSSSLGWRESNNQVVVRGLPRDVTQLDILRYFGAIGTIKTFPATGDLRIVVFLDRGSGEGRGEASVTYVEPGVARTAVMLFNGGQFLRWSDNVEFSICGRIRVSMNMIREQGDNRRGRGSGGGREEEMAAGEWDGGRIRGSMSDFREQAGVVPGGGRVEGGVSARELVARDWARLVDREAEERREQERREREEQRVRRREGIGMNNRQEVEEDYMRIEEQEVRDEQEYFIFEAADREREERQEYSEGRILGSTSSPLSSSLFASLLSSTSSTTTGPSNTSPSDNSLTSASIHPSSPPGLENEWRILDDDRKEGEPLRKAMGKLSLKEEKEEEESDGDADSEAEESEFLESVEKLCGEVRDKAVELVARLEVLNSTAREEGRSLVEEQEAAQRQERRNLADQFTCELEELRARQEPDWLGLFSGFELEKQELEEEQEQRMGVMWRQQERARQQTLEQQEEHFSRSSLAACSTSLAALTCRPSLARCPQCPGCQEEVGARILQCQAGHLLCGECGARGLQCAVCGGQVKGRATAIEHFLAQLMGMEGREEEEEEELLALRIAALESRKIVEAKAAKELHVQ